MKRRDFIRHLHHNRCVLIREGARHSIYKRLDTQMLSSVPRHTEINDFLVKKICRDLEISAP